MTPPKFAQSSEPPISAHFISSKKSKKSKREVFETEINQTLPIHIVNYQDAEVHDPDKIINGPNEFNRSLIFRFTEILNQPDDLLFFIEVLKFRNGYVNHDKCNELLDRIERTKVKETYMKPKTPFMSNSQNDYKWFRSWPEFPPNFYRILNHFTDPLAPKIFGFSEKTHNNRYLDSAINSLVQEEESYGMVIRVFICEDCEAGTSYCATDIDRINGVWTCNYCRYKNELKYNQYYLYNKIGSSFLSQSFLADINFKARSLTSDSTNFDTADGDEGSTEEKNVAFNACFEKSTFYQDTLEQNLKCKLFNTPLKVSPTEKYGDFSVVFIGLSCKEIKIGENKALYLFNITFINTKFAKQTSHRLMMVPKIRNGQRKFPLDELLSVLTDDINHLAYEGINVANKDGTSHFKFYLLNVIAETEILDIIFDNVSDPQLFNRPSDGKLLLRPYISLVFTTLLKPFIRLSIGNIKRDPALSKAWTSIIGSQISGLGDSGFGEFTEPLAEDSSLWDSHQVCEVFLKLMKRGSRNRALWNSICPQIRSYFNDMLTFLEMISIGEPYKASIQRIKDQIGKLLHDYFKLCTTYRIPNASGASVLVSIPFCLERYGRINELCEFRLSSMEYRIISERLHLKRARNIINTFNKTDVVLHNYMSIFYRFFRLLSDNTTTFRDPKESFLEKLELLLADHARNEEKLIDGLIEG